MDIHRDTLNFAANTYDTKEYKYGYPYRNFLTTIHNKILWYGGRYSPLLYLKDG